MMKKKRTIGGIAVVALLMIAPVAPALTADDIIVYRPGTTFWYASYSVPGSGFNDDGVTPPPAPVDTSLSAFGWPTGVTPLVGDVNGDGFDDMVVVQDVGSNEWQWVAAHSTDLNSDGNIEMSKTNGLSGAWLGAVSNTVLNILADINGDGIQDILNVDTGFVWTVIISTTNGIGEGVAQPAFQWGLPGDLPFAGDFNGDGFDDIGIYRGNPGTFVSLTSSAGVIGGGAQKTALFGANVWMDHTLVGDINGDGFDDLVIVEDDGVYSGALLRWIAAFGNEDGTLGGANASNLISFGLTNDVPMVADVNGDGLDDMVVVRGATTQWYSGFTIFTNGVYELGSLPGGIQNSSADFGLLGDVPLFGQLNVFAIILGDLVLDLLPGTNALALTWASSDGTDYTVETKSSLIGASWTSNSAAVGTGADITVTTAVDQAQSFYRVSAE